MFNFALALTKQCLPNWWKWSVNRKVRRVLQLWDLVRVFVLRYYWCMISYNNGMKLAVCNGLA
jgi:hypothetical protein